MNTNEKGCVGELKATIELLQKGFNVFKPINTGSVIDLIITNKDGELARLQVKYRKQEKERVKIPVNTVHNGKPVPINKSLLDGFIVYNPESDKVFYLPIKEFENITGYKNYHISSLSVFTDPNIFWKRG